MAFLTKEEVNTQVHPNYNLTMITLLVGVKIVPLNVNNYVTNQTSQLAGKVCKDSDCTNVITVVH